MRLKALSGLIVVLLVAGCSSNSQEEELRAALDRIEALEQDLAEMTVPTMEVSQAEELSKRPTIGVHVVEVTGMTPSVNYRQRKGISHSARSGVAVVELLEGGTAAASELRVGDVITEFDGEKIRTVEDLVDVLARRVVGRIIELVVVSGDGSIRNVVVEVGFTEASPITMEGAPQLSTISDALARKLATNSFWKITGSSPPSGFSRLVEIWTEELIMANAGVTSLSSADFEAHFDEQVRKHFKEAAGFNKQSTLNRVLTDYLKDS